MKMISSDMLAALFAAVTAAAFVVLVALSDRPEKEAGLTPYYTDGTTAFEEAEMIFVCRKLYSQPMGPDYFTADWIDEKWYPEKDYHVMYMAEIEKVLVKE